MEIIQFNEQISQALWEEIRADFVRIPPPGKLMLRGVSSGITWVQIKTKCSYCGRLNENNDACEHCGAPAGV